jgi:hypothetical protein
MMARNFQTQRDSSLLGKLFLLSAIIIIANFLIGIFARISANTSDEITFFDALWRVVVGQRIGIDFHYPLGIGPYQLGAMLWHWVGPHYNVMWLAITLFNLSIAFCGCIVAERTLARRTNLALLFCVTLAFQVSAPTICNDGLASLGISEFYNRHIISALAVLFLQTFGGGRISSKRENAIEVVLAASLLNIMFLTKISGFLLGVMILLAGCLLQGRTAHRLLNLCATVLAFTVIIATEFKVAGLEFLPVIKDYELAAQARLAFSFYDLARGLVSWPLASSVALLALFAVSQRFGELRLEFRCIGLIIGTYTACQFALNMTNDGDPSMWLAPAAIASLAVCMGPKPVAQQAGGPESWWRRFSPSRLAEISAREAIPLLIFVLVLVPQIMSSIVGVTIGSLVSLGIETPYVVTAAKGISFRSLYPHSGAYERSLNDAVTAISTLKLGDEPIANLDLPNPFPVLFLAPPPRGIQVLLDFGINVPLGALLEWQDIIGDACVVTIPVISSRPSVTLRLVDFTRSKLATDFHIVYQDALWSIYRRTRDCASAQR